MSATLQAHEQLVQALRLRIAAAEQRSEPADEEDAEPPDPDTDTAEVMAGRNPLKA